MASKAAAWAKEFARVKGAIPPRVLVNPPQSADPMGAGVTEDGRCVITNGGTTIWMNDYAACALARWILDTFSDPDAAKETP